jgi:hypothetical protein
MAPVFASPWQFLGATVLFGVHSRTEQLLLGSDDGVDPVWICWTDQRLAEHQLPSGYVLRQGPVRQLLPLLPPGTGVRIDPGLEHGMSFDGARLAELVPLCVPFPAGASVDLGELSIPREIRRAFAAVVDERRFVERLWFVRFRVEDGRGARDRDRRTRRRLGPSPPRDGAGPSAGRGADHGGRGPSRRRPQLGGGARAARIRAMTAARVVS